MEKDTKSILLAAIIAALASILSAYITAQVMLKQQSITIQEAREKLTGDNAYKDLEKIRQISSDLYNLTEQLLISIEQNQNVEKLTTLQNKIREKGNQLYFQAGYPFGSNAIGIVEATNNYMKSSKQNKKEELKKLRYSKQKFFTEYQEELATYQIHALPGKLPNDVATRFMKALNDAAKQQR